MPIRKTWRSVVAVAGLCVLAFLLLMLAIRPMPMHGMIWGYGTGYPAGGWGWWGRMTLGWLLPIGFWLVFIIAAAFLLRQADDRQAATPLPDEALAILRRRYAAGEIDRATFLRLSHELRETHGPQR